MGLYAAPRRRSDDITLMYVRNAFDSSLRTRVMSRASLPSTARAPQKSPRMRRPAALTHRRRVRVVKREASSDHVNVPLTFFVPIAHAGAIIGQVRPSQLSSNPYSLLCL